MDKKDMTLLIEAEDAINDMDRLLVQLTSMGHSDGLFNKIDNVYEVIMNNSHEYYQKAKKENNDKIERDDGVRILWYLGSFCIYGWEMKDYETDHSNRKT